ncbi:MAG TPA: DUF5758 domain-containing protein [bacterium]|nr:DUF5758 domain-containing protein [bacterium]
MKQDLSEIILAHKLWLESDTSGKRADLRNADLRNADMSGANLIGANLRNADLRNADMSNADLRFANLIGADLRNANLIGADLRNADLRNAKNIPDYVCAVTSITPEGDLIGWKKCRNDIIVKLLIPANARRSNGTGRKCRAEYAVTLDIIGSYYAISYHDSSVIYRKGETVHCHEWDDNRWDECSGGIHFFLTRYEAEQY